MVAAVVEVQRWPATSSLLFELTLGSEAFYSLERRLFLENHLLCLGTGQSRLFV